MAIAMAVIAAVGALAQASQESGMAEAEAKVEEYHANVKEMNARSVAQQASAEEERVRREARQVLGQQRAAIAQSGTGFGGSNADIMRQDMALAELDALNVQYAGDIERRGLLQEAEGHRYTARTLKSKAKSIRRTRWLTAASSAAQAYGGSGGSFGGGG